MPVRVEFNRIRQHQAATHRRIQEQLEDALKLSRDITRGLAPMYRGDLQDSIRASDVSRTRRGYRGTVYTRQHYAAYVEFGTGEYATKWDGRDTAWTYYHPDFGWITTTGNEPQPFMRPGYEAARPQIILLLKEVSP